MTSGDAYLVELIKTLREDVQRISDRLDAMDQRQRELMQEFVKFKTESETRSKTNGAIAGALVSVIGWVVSVLFHR